MLYELNGDKPSLGKGVFIAPNALLVGRVRVEEEASIWFSCVARGDINEIAIGKQSNIQDGCLMHVTNHHALRVGDRVTVGHGAILHGCEIEPDCLIAMGAIVLDGALVGAHSVVAAGCLVSPGTQIPPGSLVMGVPGKVVRQVNERDREMIEKGWQNYVGYRQTFLESLRELTY